MTFGEKDERQLGVDAIRRDDETRRGVGAAHWGRRLGTGRPEGAPPTIWATPGARHSNVQRLAQVDALLRHYLVSSRSVRLVRAAGRFLITRSPFSPARRLEEAP